MSELKAGDQMDFSVGGQTLTIEALPYGQLKKILKYFFEVGKEIKDGQVTEISDVVDRYIGTILPLLFVAGKYPFLNPEWADSNLTVPQIRKMVDAAVVVNGLADFFGKGKLAALASPSETPKTPSVSSGSTTSAGSPTDGALPK